MKPTLSLMGAAIVMATLLASCTKEKCSGNIERNYNLTDFNRIEAGQNFDITITKGNDYSIKASGCGNDVEDIRISKSSGNTLNIEYPDYKSSRSRVQFNITLPVLNSLILSGASRAAVENFQDQNSVMHNILSGDAACTLNGTAINTHVELSGAAKLTVTGTTTNLYGSLSGDARMESYGLTSQEVDISTSGKAIAYVFPQQSFFAEASGDSRIYYKGQPQVKSTATSGTAKVIQQ